MKTAATDHWQRAYADRPSDSLSWTEAVPSISLELIEEAELPREAAIVDMGGGASRLAGELVGRGYSDVTVADISSTGMEQAKSALGEDAARVRWVVADARDHSFDRRFDLWHDRAVFHFMVEEGDRRGYLDVLNQSLKPGGHLVLATFGPQGPTECSGLPVRRYDDVEIADLLGDEYEPLSCRRQEHLTPVGNPQQFVYVHLRRR